MENEEVFQDKQGLREKAKRIRNMLSAEEVQKKSAAICQFISSWEPFEKASRIVFFAPLPGEPDLLLLADQYLLQKRIGFPLVHGSDLHIHHVTALDQLSPGSFHILEPKLKNDSVYMEDAELIFVPALALDRMGHRLGFGKGFYDRFLPRQKGIPVGINFDALIFGEVPSEAHDIPMQYIITESGIYKTNR